MREIKFRAWDGSKYLYLDRADFEIAHCGVQVYAEFGGSRPLRCYLEQYTGLHDKNGKEIYEGDIVSIEHILVYERTVIHPKRNAIMAWDEGETGFRLSSDSVKNTNPDIYPVCCLEVIGNIHENPELVK